MADLIRDAPFGQLVRYVTGNKYFKYPEERPGFTCPGYYTDLDENQRQHAAGPTTSRWSSNLSTPCSEGTIDVEKDSLESCETADARHASANLDGPSEPPTGADLEQATTKASLARPPTIPVVPEKLADGTILVDWYTSDDPENPQNWSSRRKGFVSFWIYTYTFAVYLGSAIYSPFIPGVMEDFGVSAVAASLGLALYVLAYGIGPLIFSPLSELPIIGRNPPYIITFTIFVIITIPASLADNFAGLMILRFLQGFFGSPCLATGGASLQDVYSFIKLPYVICIWSLAATCGPALGPIVSGFAVTAKDWHWSMWEMLWLSTPTLLGMFFFLPETSSSNTLLRRAKRLRQTTRNPHLRSQSEIDQANTTPKTLAYEALVRPVQLILLDPSIGFTAAYVALLYAIFYSFFEAFPLVYTHLYAFNLGETGLTFLSVAIGVLLAVTLYFAYIYYLVEPEIRDKGPGAPERRLIPALFASLLPPIGLFIFGWTSNGRIHWIVRLVGVAIYVVGISILLQSIFLYLPLSYPQYSASLFAGNDLARSTIAAAAVLFSGPIFHGMGIGGGTSLLGGLTVFGIVGIFILWRFGHRWRARSTFAAK